MGFQVCGLGAETFAEMFAMGDADLRARRALLRVATHRPGFPCRVSLVDAAVGEAVLLVNYTHQAAMSPFYGSHAIYVRRNAVEARLAEDEVPEMLRCRQLAVRGFDDEGMMHKAELVDGMRLEAAIGRLFAMEPVRYLQVHAAKEGCYLVRVDRCAQVVG